MPDQNPQKKKKQSLPTSWAKISVMGFQMLAIIGLGMFGGLKLDEYLGFQKVPIFTLVLTLLSVGIALWYFIRDSLKK